MQFHVVFRVKETLKHARVWVKSTGEWTARKHGSHNTQKMEEKVQILTQTVN